MAEEDLPKKVPTDQKSLDAMRAIAEMDTVMAARMTEHQFRSIIIPIFVEEGGSLDTWVQVTGSLQRPIDVIDDKGQVLFRAPAPLASLHTSVDHTRANGFSEIVQRTEALIQQHPALGLNYQKDKLAQRSEEFVSNDTPERQQWVKIMRHFGYVPNDGQLTGTNTADTDIAPKPIFGDVDEPL